MNHELRDQCKNCGSFDVDQESEHTVEKFRDFLAMDKDDEAENKKDHLQD
jgi:hypothetical protein